MIISAFRKPYENSAWETACLDGHSSTLLTFLCSKESNILTLQGYFSHLNFHLAQMLFITCNLSTYWVSLSWNWILAHFLGSFVQGSLPELQTLLPQSAGQFVWFIIRVKWDIVCESLQKTINQCLHVGWCGLDLVLEVLRIGLAIFISTSHTWCWIVCWLIRHHRVNFPERIG